MIIDKRWIVKFKDVKPGQAFDYDGCIYIKAECSVVLLKDIDGMPSINAVGLNNGSYTNMNPDDEVTVYDNAKVVLM